MKTKLCLAALSVLAMAMAVAADSISGGNATLQQGGRPLLEYVSSGDGFTAFKPYIRQFCSPAGVNPLRDGVADHPHHHGLMFALSAGDVDFWAEQQECGKQAQQGLGFQASGGKPGSWDRRTLRGTVNWLAGDGTVLAREARSIEVYGRVAGCSLLTWRTRLSPAEEGKQVRLTGAHYVGLGMRLAESMDKVSTLAFADEDARSVVVRGAEKLTPSTWVCLSGAVGGKDVTIALFDHPANPRRVAWFTMLEPFAYLSATLGLSEKPLEISAEQPLDVRYGVAVWDGTPGREQVRAVYERWLKLSEPAK